MRSYDLGLRAGGQEVLAQAKLLGFAGVGVLVQGEAEPQREPGLPGLEVAWGTETRGLQGLAGLRQQGLVAVQAPGLGEARAALERGGMDLLFCTELDAVTARLARTQGIAIAFDFSRVLHAFGKSRAEAMAQYVNQARYVRKYRPLFILTSGARSPWDLRGPSDLLAFGRVLGLPEGGLDGRLLQEVRKKLAPGWIQPGVERV